MLRMAYAVLLAFLTALVVTPLVRTAALRLGIVDTPNHRKIHTRPTALLGGVAVLASVAIVVLGALPTRDVIMLLAGGLLFLAIGLVDDIRALGTSKLVAEFVGAWLIVAVTGAQFHLPWPGAGTALTVLWIVGVVNAFNCIDCADGVAASVGLSASLAFAAIAWLTNQRLEMLLAASVAGACLGFLPYNFSPARIFLGDAGSLTLGYLVAMVGVMLSPGVLSIPAMATPAVVLAIPIYDIIFVHVARYRTGQRSLRDLLTSTGKDHLPHRLLGRGLSPRAVGSVFLLGSAVSGVTGVALAAVNTLFGALAIGLAVLAALILLEREWVGAGPSGAVVSPPGLRSSEGP